jgi:hypothetical protein
MGRRARTQNCSDLLHESLPGGWSTPDAGGLVHRDGDNPFALGVERRGHDLVCVLQWWNEKLVGRPGFY